MYQYIAILVHWFNLSYFEYYFIRSFNKFSISATCICWLNNEYRVKNLLFCFAVCNTFPFQTYYNSFGICNPIVC